MSGTTVGEGPNWKAPAPAPGMPYGWTDGDLATVVRMGQEFGISPLEILALFYSESGLNPKASPEGLAGLTPVIETEMGWPHGTIAQLNAGPITGYLQAVFQLWAHVQEKYVGKTFTAKGNEWGVSPGAALYTFHGFLGPAMQAHGTNAILGKKPASWPVTWQNGGWSFNGAPIALTPLEAEYAGNPGLDIGNKGTITVGDMAARVKNKAQQLQADPNGAILYHRLQSFDTLPSSGPQAVPPLSDLFGAIQGVWKQLTGTNIRTKVAATAGEAPNTTTPSTATPETPAAGAAVPASSGAALLLAGAVALAAWHFLGQRKP